MKKRIVFRIGIYAIMGFISTVGILSCDRTEKDQTVLIPRLSEPWSSAWNGYGSSGFL